MRVSEIRVKRIRVNQGLGVDENVNEVENVWIQNTLVINSHIS